MFKTKRTKPSVLKKRNPDHHQNKQIYSQFEIQQTVHELSKQFITVAIYKKSRLISHSNNKFSNFFQSRMTSIFASRMTSLNFPLPRAKKQAFEEHSFKQFNKPQ